MKSRGLGDVYKRQINAGSMDSQRIRIIGSRASLEWTDSSPGELKYEVQGQPNQTMHHGMPYLHESALADERLGALHTEGLAESWANIYLKFAIAISAQQRGDAATLRELVYPDINAGLEGVRWLENCVRSADNGSTWVNYE